MFLVLLLILVAIIVVFLFVFKPFEEKVEYDKDKYEGIDTKQFEATSRELREFITNRDDNSVESMPKPEDLCKLLKSDLKTGLDGTDFEIRQKQYFSINI
jgi:uncharacterized protein YpmS